MTRLYGRGAGVAPVPPPAPPAPIESPRAPPAAGRAPAGPAVVAGGVDRHAVPRTVSAAPRANAVRKEVMAAGWVRGLPDPVGGGRTGAPARRPARGVWL